MPRRFIKEKRLDAEQQPRGHLAAVRISDGKANAFRESEQDGAMSTADQLSERTTSIKLSGALIQGENNTLNVCDLLRRKRNTQGEKWLPPTAAQMRSPHRPNNTVRIQSLNCSITPIALVR